MRGRYQGGSLAGFAIIGAVLALVLIGGLYGLNRYNTEQAQQAAEEGEPTEVAIDGDKSTSDAESKKPGDTSKESSSSDKESSSGAGSSSGSDDEKQSESSSASSEEMAATGKEVTATELPATGPADTVASIIGVIALSFATAAYLQSRTQNNR